MKDFTPTWHREATTRGINFVVLVYEKAEGFVLRLIEGRWPW